MSARALATYVGKRYQFFRLNSRYAKENLAAAKAKLKSGKDLFVLGVGCAGHNSGAGLVRASLDRGIEIIANHEEERFLSLKHCKQFPKFSIDAARRDLRGLGLDLNQVDATVSTWDYVELLAQLGGHVAGELPESRHMLRESASPTFSFWDMCAAFRAPKLIGKQVNRGKSMPIINLRHHDNHAYLAWGASPFAKSDQPTLVAVIDGLGDDSPTSLYRGGTGKLERFYMAEGMFDSIGQMYLYLSSSQGGWSPLSSEGRFMGAAAWGNMDRQTNPYYQPLRELFHFGSNGELFLNRKMANWHLYGSIRPYKKRLTEILGPPISQEQMWDPDHVLRVEDIRHAPITQDRVDKAAATQLLFEDAIFHVIEFGIRETGASQVVFAGGAALNCVASKRLLEHFSDEWYQRNLNRNHARLQLWVPPMPNDAGSPVGAAYHFACLAGAGRLSTRSRLRDPFLCGHAPTTSDIQRAIKQDDQIDFQSVGDVNVSEDLAGIADLMAFMVSQDGVIGIYQGRAETGPRALGHRSILANPTNPNTLQTINERVKFREIIRPLAPMATLQSAQQLFNLLEGASAEDYDAYNYMVFTAVARQEARQLIPAVVHRDGTSRIQIVREDVDPLIHAYLKAMGRRVGVEVSVNTSLNVGSPIVQSPVQALSALKKSKGLHGLFMVGQDGQCQVAWHKAHSEKKDGGQQLRQWIQDWKAGYQNQSCS